MRPKKITIMTPCYNEEANIKACYEAVRQIFDTELNQYELEHLFIDNCSQDRTVEILRDIARLDRRVKVIVNARNFGPHQSPYYAILQSTGDAVIPVTADLQTPPDLIPAFVREWERGYRMVLGVRTHMHEGLFVRTLRNAYYNLIARISHVQQVKQFIGYGLFDKSIVDILRGIGDAMPYFRGIISEIGFDRAFIEYEQPPRLRGKSRHSVFDLIDMAALGIFSYSKVPLRVMAVLGVIIAAVSLGVAFVYLILKLIFWEHFSLGLAPILLAVLFFGAVQMLCFGIVGEYIGLILTQVKRRPMVIEKERINFDP